MKGFILVLAGLAAISACSDVRDRRAPAAVNSAPQTDLTLPDTMLASDSAFRLSSRGDRPVSPVEQQVTEPADRPSKARPAARRPNRPIRPATPPPDTSTQAYAPNAVGDTATKPDTAAADTASKTVAGDTAASTSDTAHAATADTVATRAPDTWPLEPQTQ